MSYQAVVIEIFLSSPADVNPEREFVVQYANEWNRLRSRSTGCFLSVLTWENLVAPALSGRAQDAVIDQVGNDYDVYLGMMWTKFGTPTGIADSGTEEEFNAALERSQSGQVLRIATMFKKGEIDPTTIDAVQLVKVQEFKKRVADLGAFYREFSDDNSLRSILNLLFEQIAKDKDKYASFFLSDTGRGEAVNLPAISLIEDQDDEDEEGLIELGESFTRLVEEFSEKLQRLVEYESDNSAIINECTQLISDALKFGQPDAAGIKAIMRKAADGMNELAARYEALLDAVESDASLMADLIDKDLRIRLDFDDPMESGSGNIDAAKQLIGGINSAYGELQSLIHTTDTLPRLSTDVNKAKKRLSKPRKKLLLIFDSLRESVENSINYFETSTADEVEQ